MADVTAFEMITSRVSNYTDVAVSKYQAVAIADDGRYTVADGTKPFIGICQYGNDAADQVITVVRGIFPGVAGVAITAGMKLGLNASGAFIAATDQAVGIALSAAAAEELVAVQILDTPFTVS